MLDNVVCLRPMITMIIGRTLSDLLINYLLILSLLGVRMLCSFEVLTFLFSRWWVAAWVSIDSFDDRIDCFLVLSLNLFGILVLFFSWWANLRAFVGRRARTIVRVIIWAIRIFARVWSLSTTATIISLFFVIHQRVNLFLNLEHASRLFCLCKKGMSVWSVILTLSWTIYSKVRERVDCLLLIRIIGRWVACWTWVV